MREAASSSCFPTSTQSNCTTHPVVTLLIAIGVPSVPVVFVCRDPSNWQSFCGTIRNGHRRAEKKSSGQINYPHQIVETGYRNSNVMDCEHHWQWRTGVQAWCLWPRRCCFGWTKKAIQFSNRAYSGRWGSRWKGDQSDRPSCHNDIKWLSHS